MYLRLPDQEEEKDRRQESELVQVTARCLRACNWGPDDRVAAGDVSSGKRLMRISTEPRCHARRCPAL